MLLQAGVLVSWRLCDCSVVLAPCPCWCPACATHFAVQLTVCCSALSSRIGVAADLVKQLLAAGASPSEPEDNALLQPLHLACMGEITLSDQVRMQLPGGDQLHAAYCISVQHAPMNSWAVDRCKASLGRPRSDFGQLPAGMCTQTTVRGVARTTL